MNIKLNFNRKTQVKKNWRKTNWDTIFGFFSRVKTLVCMIEQMFLHRFTNVTQHKIYNRFIMLFS